MRFFYFNFISLVKKKAPCGAFLKQSINDCFRRLEHHQI